MCLIVNICVHRCVLQINSEMFWVYIVLKILYTHTHVHIQLYAMHDVEHGFLGILWSIEYMHGEWVNIHQIPGDVNKRKVIMESRQYTISSDVIRYMNLACIFFGVVWSNEDLDALHEPHKIHLSVDGIYP